MKTRKIFGRRVWALRIIAACCWSAAFSSAVYGQGEVFKVLAGKNAFAGAPNVQESWRAARAGVSLHSSSVLKIERGGYAALLRLSGGTLELREPGAYAIADLEKRFSANAPQTGIAAKAAQFIAGAVSRSNGQTHQKNMSNLGAVARMSTGSAERLRPLAPRAGRLLDSTAEFLWRAYDAGGGAGGISFGGARKSARQSVLYDFRITDARGNVVFSRRLADTALRAPLGSLGLTRGGSYAWSAGATNAAASVSEPLAFVWASEAEVAALADTAAALRSQCADPEAAIVWIALARLYEQNGAAREALRAYRAALRAAPEIREYQDLYEAFLSAVGLTEEDAAHIPAASQ